VNTAAAQAGSGGDFSDRQSCTVGGHDSADTLPCGFVEPCGRQVESGLQLSFMPDTLSECFTSFHTLRIRVCDVGVQQTGRDNTTCCSVALGGLWETRRGRHGRFPLGEANLETHVGTSHTSSIDTAIGRRPAGSPVSLTPSVPGCVPGGLPEDPWKSSPAESVLGLPHLIRRRDQDGLVFL
jgi:hypothetical protein